MMMRSRWFVASGAFLALIVVLGIWLGFSGGSGTSHQARPPSTASPPTTTPAPRTGCHPTDRNQAVPTTSPTGVSWQLFNSVALPYSKTAGPLLVDGLVARCFAHTPTGALLAAAQIGTRAQLSPQWREVDLAQVLPGPGRDRLMTELAQVASFAPPEGGYGQFAGFEFQSYDPTEATIEFVSRFRSGAMQVTAETVRWSGGDWKLQLQPDGGTSATAQPVTDLTGFVPWGGV